MATSFIVTTLCWRWLMAETRSGNSGTMGSFKTSSTTWKEATNAFNLSFESKGKTCATAAHICGQSA